MGQKEQKEQKGGKGKSSSAKSTVPKDEAYWKEIRGSFQSEEADEEKENPFLKKHATGKKHQVPPYRFHYKKTERYAYDRGAKPKLTTPATKKIFFICLFTIIIYIFIFYVRFLTN